MPTANVAIMPMSFKVPCLKEWTRMGSLAAMRMHNNQHTTRNHVGIAHWCHHSPFNTCQPHGQPEPRQLQWQLPCLYTTSTLQMLCAPCPNTSTVKRLSNVKYLRQCMPHCCKFEKGNYQHPFLPIYVQHLHHITTTTTQSQQPCLTLRSRKCTRICN